MLRILLISFTLISLFSACTSNPSALPNDDASLQFMRPPSEIRKALIAHIQTKGKKAATTLMQALETFKQKHQAYPKSIAELEPKDQISGFDLTDFNNPRDPEIAGFVFQSDRPVIYDLNFDSDGKTFTMGFRYTVYGMTGMSYSSTSGEWTQEPTYF